MASLERLLNFQRDFGCFKEIELLKLEFLKTMRLSEVGMWGWRDGSAVKHTCCAHRASQHPQLLVTPVSWASDVLF